MLDTLHQDFPVDKGIGSGSPCFCGFRHRRVEAGDIFELRLQRDGFPGISLLMDLDQFEECPPLAGIDRK
jgi:hypothetical protein